MDSETNTDQFLGYDVVDGSGNKLGAVDGLWVDDATSRPEFIAVRSSPLFGKSHVIPIEEGDIDPISRTIQVPYSADQVKNAPSFDTDAELDMDDEEEIYGFYGMERSTGTSPTGYAAGSGLGGTALVNEPEEAEGVDMTLSEEELLVGKRETRVGQVRLRKVVRTEYQEVPVELRHETVDIERVSVAGAGVTDVPEDAFQEQEIDVPVMREEAVVAKEAHVTGQVHVGKNVTTRTETVTGETRHEDVEIDQRDVDDFVDNADDRL